MYVEGLEEAVVMDIANRTGAGGLHSNDGDIFSVDLDSIPNTLYANGYTVVYIAKGNQETRKLIAKQLDELVIPYDDILMVDEDTIRDKFDAIDKDIVGKYNIKFLMSDDAVLCRLIKQIGINTIQVREGVKHE